MAESMATGWYYMQGGPAGPQQGPLTWEQLYGLRASGTLQPGDLVWHPTMPQWMPAGQIQQLFPETPAPSPTAQADPRQQAAYQQAGQPAWAGQGAYQAAPRSRSKMLAWLIPLIVVVIIGAALGAYFGVWYGKGDGDPLPSSYYGEWEGTIVYTSIDIDDATAADKASRDLVLDEELPVTIDIYEDGDTDVARVTIDIGSVDPSRGEITDTFICVYSESGNELTLESERTSDTAEAEVSKQGGSLVMEGKLTYEAARDSGKAEWSVSK